MSRATRWRALVAAGPCAAAACVLAAAEPALGARALASEEIQITSAPTVDTTPRLGEDPFTELVVYTRQEELASGPGPGRVYYQRYDASGRIGEAQRVSFGPTHDVADDASGEEIVFTAFAPTSPLGHLMLHRVSTGVTKQVTGLGEIRGARIHGSTIAWVEGSVGATRVLTLDLDLLDEGVVPTIVAGATPPATDVEVGERFVVWQEESGGQRDVVAHDLETGEEVVIAADPDVDEGSPATSGEWVVWEEGSGAATAIRALHVATGERRTLVDDGGANLAPRIDGDLVAWESDAAGSFDLRLHRLSTKETFRLTDHPADQRLGDLRGESVAYTDARDGDRDVFVARFSLVAGDLDADGDVDAADFSLFLAAYGSCEGDPAFLAAADYDEDGCVTLVDYQTWFGYFVATSNRPPVADAGPDLALEPTEPGELQGSASDPDSDPIISWQWAVESSPTGSNPLLSSTIVPNPNFSGDLEGDYLLSLVVSDGIDTSQPSLVTVTVVANQPPVAVAEADVTRGPAPLTVQFDASASYDPEDSTLSYIWRFDDGTPTESSVSPGHVFQSTGEYLVELSVVDDRGQVDIDVVRITVEPEP